MKAKIKRWLRYWYVYLILIASSAIASVYYCDFINRPQNEETIDLFVASYTTDSRALQSFLEEKAPDYLREINITMVNPKTADFEYFMVNKGLNKADLFILPESYFFDDLLTNQFAELKEEVLSPYFTYETEALNRGVLFHKIGQEDNSLMTFKNEKYEDENYYLFYRVNSLHCGGLNEGAKADTSLLFTKYLLESYE